MTSLRQSHQMEELGISKAASKIRNWRKSGKLEIELADHYLAKIYSSGSVVQGHLSISPASDIYASSITMSLDGVTTILGLNNPHKESLAQNTFPVHFTLSTGLNGLYTRCRINNCHRQAFDPPPTIGGEWDRHDMSPGVVEVEYGINACIASTPSLDTGHSQDFTAKRAIQFIPRLSESPPLHVSLMNRRYKLQGTKSLRSNSFKRPFGIISATAMQPEPLHLQAYGTVITPSFIDVTLTFDPENDGITPPKLDSVSLSIRSNTWHQADPYQAFPDQIEKPSLKQPFITSIELTVDRPQVTWARHVNPGLEDKSSENSSVAFYSSTLQLPLSVSTRNKTFLPTFHSCLVSRTYDVSLRLGFKKGDLTIAAPLQIIADP
ncbi:hypothetical protein FOXG_15182 [Fusarium oxysporum f. sp. lycopersici 4287]|uniref:Arrestin-like N-terminal domain-containing protein n=1 Tax=Fusarium oxysporum f. sp. lycopersici (strain 4287 / CBS 123668 / FGSC 9935 / NRRL 34936) TaxID=426428 RepID=A0A0J9W2C6_FUSO4|nr:hypothetical protein FOXG_15182 [Fusarium oxysporum f. sp. lycopersici 4287]KNB17025.1 hypothetical protein FOXG_15182 [Fusarium oxysporum f. sp. lycopersici 4287]